MAELNDPNRLAELRTSMLRADADAVLDTCIAQAVELSGAPIALVSLVVRHIQLFRAHRGLPPELAVSCATSRSNSFCRLVVQREAPLVVEDAVEDARVPKELVEQYGIRAYAGVPVRVGGHTLGTVCVIDVVPRRFAPGLIVGLERIAADVADRLDQLANDEAAPADRQQGLVHIEQTARVLEHALNAIAPVIARAHAAVPALASAPMRADLLAAVGCYRDLLAITRELAEDAAALACRAPTAVSSEIAAGSRALMRDMAEISPLIRLAERVLDGTLGTAEAAKAAIVARDAFAAHETASAALRRILVAIPSAAPPIKDATGRAAAREVS